MSTPPAADVTQLPLTWRQRDAAVLARLLPPIYADLHCLAPTSIVGERLRQTRQTADRLQEEYLRVVEGTGSV